MSTIQVKTLDKALGPIGMADAMAEAAHIFTTGRSSCLGVDPSLFTDLATYTTPVYLALNYDEQNMSLMLARPSTFFVSALLYAYGCSFLYQNVNSTHAAAAFGFTETL